MMILVLSEISVVFPQRHVMAASRLLHHEHSYNAIHGINSGTLYVHNKTPFLYIFYSIYLNGILSTEARIGAAMGSC